MFESKDYSLYVFWREITIFLKVSDDEWEGFTLQALWRVCCEGVRNVPAVTPGPPRLVRHRDLLLEETGEDADALVNEVQTAAELKALRCSVVRGRPYGSAAWVAAVVRELGLQATVRPRGRPRKRPAQALPQAPQPPQ